MTDQHLPDEPLADDEAIVRLKQVMRKSSAQTRKLAAEALSNRPDGLTAPAALAAQTGALERLYPERAQSKPKIVAGYWPIRTEIDPRPLMQALQNSGHILSLPSTPEPGLPLRFHEWSGAESALVEGPYKTRQPDADSPVIVPDLVLAPLLAFDSRCWRLGYGGGFYDRVLAAFETAGHSARIIGLAYSEQQVPQVPKGHYDRQLDGILTPDGLILAQKTRTG